MSNPNFQVEMDALVKKHIAALAAPVASPALGAALPGVAPLGPPVGPPVVNNYAPQYASPPPANIPESIGWSVPVEIPVQDSRGWGKATVHLAFPAATWPHAQNIIHGLIAAQFEVRLFRPKPPRQYDQGGRPPGGGGQSRGY